MTTATLSRPRAVQREEPEWLVWALIALMLVIGLIARSVTENRTQQWSGGGVSFNYPAEWVSFAPEGQLLQVGDPFSSPQFPTSVSVQEVPVADVGRNLTALGDVALAWSARRGRDLVAYRALRTEPVTVGGQEAVRLEYAYVAESVLGNTNAAPIVARAQDVLVQRGDSLTIITFAADSSQWDEALGIWRTILASLRGI
ncbi:MAG TPA: hypothetical protein VF707_03430 [Ardenticatenaceae bacterium]|jgi:hypothetical protein